MSLLQFWLSVLNFSIQLLLFRQFQRCLFFSEIFIGSWYSCWQFLTSWFGLTILFIIYLLFLVINIKHLNMFTFVIIFTSKNNLQLVWIELWSITCLFSVWHAHAQRGRLQFRVYFWNSQLPKPLQAMSHWERKGDLRLPNRTECPRRWWPHHKRWSWTRFNSNKHQSDKGRRCKLHSII